MTTDTQKGNAPPPLASLVWSLPCTSALAMESLLEAGLLELGWQLSIARLPLAPACGVRCQNRSTGPIFPHSRPLLTMAGLRAGHPGQQARYLLPWVREVYPPTALRADRGPAHGERV